jgi:hypothetical protein
VDVEHFGFLSSVIRKPESHEQDGETLGANGALKPASGDPAMAFVLPSVCPGNLFVPGTLGGLCRHATASLDGSPTSARGESRARNTQRRMPSFSMMLL